MDALTPTGYVVVEDDDGNGYHVTVEWFAATDVYMPMVTIKSVNPDASDVTGFPVTLNESGLDELIAALERARGAVYRP